VNDDDGDEDNMKNGQKCYGIFQSYCNLNIYLEMLIMQRTLYDMQIK